jgi:cellulose biosynthesis protein BcsQ
MTGKLIAVANRKGGVGKTTLSIALGQTFVSEHKSDVFLLDLDPQASASTALLGQTRYEQRVRDDKTLTALLKLPEAAELAGYIESQTNHVVHGIPHRAAINMAIIANDDSMWDLERQSFHKAAFYEVALRALIDYLRNKYDYVIADCPPGWTIASDLVLKEADFVLCPVVPDRFSVWGMGKFSAYIRQIRPTGADWRFVVTMRTNTNTARDQIASIYRDYAANMLYGQNTGEAAADLLIFDRTQKMIDGIGLRGQGNGILQALDRRFGPDQSQKLHRLANQIRRLLGQEVSRG